MPNALDLVVYPGDGIGPETISETVRVLDALANVYDFFVDYHTCEIGDVQLAKGEEAIPS